MQSCDALISLGVFLVSLLLKGFTDGYEIIVRPTVAFLSKMLPLFFFYFTSSSVHMHLLRSNHIFWCLPLSVSTAFTLIFAKRFLDKHRRGMQHIKIAHCCDCCL